MKVLEDTIMGKVSYGMFVYPSGIGGNTASRFVETDDTSSSSTSESESDGGSFMDHLGYLNDALSRDNTWGFGTQDSSHICGGCHPTFNGNHSGFGSSSGDKTGFSSDIGGESGYGAIGL